MGILNEANSYAYREYLDNTMDDEPMSYLQWRDFNDELTQLNIDYDIEIDQFERAGGELTAELKQRRDDLLHQIMQLEAILAY